MRAAAGGIAGSARSRTAAAVVHCSGQCRPNAPSPAGGRGRGAGRGGRGGGNRRGPQVNEEQVKWDTPIRKDPVVAIIGGGLSGLVCGQSLARRGVRCVVFDTGEHSAGGRLATRATASGSLRPEALPSEGLVNAGLAFDHAAQFFTATDPRFQKLVDEWVADGAVREWGGPVGTLDAKTGRFEAAAAGGAPRYIAAGGMAQLAERLAQPEGRAGPLFELRRPIWVSRFSPVPAKGGWQLTGANRSQGFFDAVVISHNGKCANRLAAPSGAPAVAKQLMRLRLSAVWALIVAFPEPVAAPFEGAFISGSPVLSWAANNTAKLGLTHPGLPGAQCWTLFSTSAYGRANKVPQESVPPEVAERVKDEMLAAFRSALGPSAAALPAPVFWKAQLWGAALPTNSPGAPFILDRVARVGVCGDWLTDRPKEEGASMQAAAVSGLALADALVRLVKGGGGDGGLTDLAVGLTEEFRPLSNHDIGGFPGQQPEVQAPVPAPVTAGAKGSRGGGGGGGAMVGGAKRPQRPPQQQQRVAV